jgi:hypothetical protein
MRTFKEAIRKIELELRDLIVSRPDLSYRVIAGLFDVSEDTVLKIARKFNVRRKPGRKLNALKKVDGAAE